MAPEIRYARSGDANIAYMVVGDGPVDLLFATGTLSHIEHLWEEPGLARFMERLATFSRLILYDRRGIGMSDPVDVDWPLGHDVADLGAVLDAAGSERAFLLGYVMGAVACVEFASRHPERVQGLIFYAAMSKAVMPLVFTMPRRSQGNLVLWLPPTVFSPPPPDKSPVPVRISAVQLFLKVAPPARTYAPVESLVEKEGDRERRGSGSGSDQGDSEN